jgi:CheY-like chemotaxis protein
MKILVVDPDAARAAGVVDALVEAGAMATVAPSASFALTMLEWDRPDVIVSRAQAGDMDGPEFCGMVRADPSAAGVRFVLIARDVTPVQMAQHRIDLVIPEGLVGHAIATRVMHLLRREPPAASAPVLPIPAPAAVAAPPPAPAPVQDPPPREEPRTEAPSPPPEDSLAALEAALLAVPVVRVARAVAPAAPAATAPPPPSVPAPPPPRAAVPAAPSLAELEGVGVNGATRTFQGVLGTLTLEDLAGALAAGSKTGRLLLVLSTGGGMIAFDGGRIVHAEVGNTTGETAFEALVAASHRENGGKFCFIPAAARDLATVPKTITRSVADLLVGVPRATEAER